MTEQAQGNLVQSNFSSAPLFTDCSVRKKIIKV